MDYKEAIDKRISRRTYTDTKISIANVKIMKDKITELNLKSDLSILYIEDASSVFNSFKKSYGLFKGVRSIIVMKGLKNDSNLKEKVGYFGELVVLEATTLGLGTCWVGGTYDRKSEILKVSDTEEVVCVITIGNVPQSKSLKEKFIFNMTHRKTKDIDKFYESNEQVDDWFIEGIKAVQKAPSAVNSQKVKFECMTGRISAKVPDTYTLDLVDLGIAKLHFEIATGRYFTFGNGAILI